MRPVVDVALAAAETIAVVYVLRGAFAHRHLLAEARRHLFYALRGRRHQRGLDEQIVQTAIDAYTCPVGRGLMMTADLHALYPRDAEDQAVLRALTRNRSATPYERARLAADALTARVQAARRADRLNSRTRPRTLAVPAEPGTPRPFRTGRRAGRVPEQRTDVATVEQTRQTLEAAAAKMAAKLQDGIRDRAAARSLRTQPTPPTAPTQLPGPEHTPSRTTGGVA
ncbi:hypothetical protein ACFYYM_31630 [Streptomyces erythrochromogenes]|uniref:hypothetical protein n=1 Tax=Streptomyces erythrochromogenes TaxID=285574 RepID=UPI00368260E3